MRDIYGWNGINVSYISDKSTESLEPNLPKFLFIPLQHRRVCSQLGLLNVFTMSFLRSVFFNLVAMITYHFLDYHEHLSLLDTVRVSISTRLGNRTKKWAACPGIAPFSDIGEIARPHGLKSPVMIISSYLNFLLKYVTQDRL